jgi:hypothetical protein
MTLQWKVIVNGVLHHARFQTYFPLHYLAIIINSHVQTRFESLTHFVVVIGESDVFIQLHVQQTMTYKLIERDPKAI